MGNAEDSGEFVPQANKRTRRASHVLRGFGDLLVDLRGEKSVQQIVNAMKAFSADAIVTYQPTIAEYESGKVWSPDPCVLWGLARVFHVSLDGLVAVLCKNRQDDGLTLRDAQRIMEAHYVGPSPELAAASLTNVANRLSTFASDLHHLAAFGGTGNLASHRRQAGAARTVSRREPSRDRTDD